MIECASLYWYTSKLLVAFLMHVEPLVITSLFVLAVSRLLLRNACPPDQPCSFFFFFKPTSQWRHGDGNKTYLVYPSPASWLSDICSLPVYPALHPSIWAFLPSFFYLWGSMVYIRSLSLCLTLCVTWVSQKLLALILYLSAVATISGFPAPTKSFISDLQRKTWETLSHAHTW